MPHTMPRLYLAVRADLSPGLQAAQAVHAAIEYAVENPHSAAHWHHTSNNVIVVSVPDEWALMTLGTQASAAGIRSYPVREPDLGNTFTAIAFEPGRAARKLCADLPLALGLPAPGEPLPSWLTAYVRDHKLAEIARREVADEHRGEVADVVGPIEPKEFPVD